MYIEQDVEYSKLTTYKLAGCAKSVYYPESIDELIELLQILGKNKTKYVIIGNGSNVIFSDLFDGVVVCVRKLNRINCLDGYLLEVECGVLNAELIRFSVEHEYGGVEFLTGIPGCIGAGVINNVGAFGGDISDIVVKVQYIDQKGKLCWVERDECKFSYRFSAFKKMQNVITKVIIKLEKREKRDIVSKITQCANMRVAKQPTGFSCGSVFKNPPNNYAGALIEGVGIKGLEIGDAKISEKHGNFIINKGCAKSADVLKLIEIARLLVYNKYNIILETEVQIIE